MTNEQKKEYGIRLVKLVEEVQQLSHDTGISIDIQGSSIYPAHVWLHYRDAETGELTRMVSVKNSAEVEEAFFVERDDTVRTEEVKQNEGKDNTEV